MLQGWDTMHSSPAWVSAIRLTGIETRCFKAPVTSLQGARCRGAPHLPHLALQRIGLGGARHRVVQPRARHVAERPRHVVVPARREQALRILCTQKRECSGHVAYAICHVRIIKGHGTVQRPGGDPASRGQALRIFYTLKSCRLRVSLLCNLL